MFLKKFLLKIHQRVPLTYDNEETGEKMPQLNDEQEVIFENQILGVCLLDLSPWYYFKLGL